MILSSLTKFRQQFKHRKFKVLVFCADTLPLPGLPTSGGGLRCWQIINGLKSAGFEVVASMPLFTFLSKSFESAIPQKIRDLSWNFDTQDAIVEREKPDAMVFSSTWVVYNLKKKYKIPIIFDLHGPQILEQFYKQEDWQLNIQQKINRFKQADFFTCAGERQKYYFFPFIMQAGIFPDQSKIATIPISLSPKLSRHKYPKQPHFVCGGGFFPWQNYINGLEILNDRLPGNRSAQLTILGGSHHLTAEDEDDFNKLHKKLNSNPQVEYTGFIPREDMLNNYYLKASVALDLMAQNPERELAFTTRTVEYMWAGLPVIYNNFSELSYYLERYNAGWVVDPRDLKSLDRLMKKLVNSPAEIFRYKGKNAQRLVKSMFTWDKTIKPLVAFLRENNIKPR